ncbi:MAG TPA: alpha/beta hydrolase [Saprospiraceae bacterium]|nr:alpha/beta hydrolase [Saprospiraceae bacterium]
MKTTNGRIIAVFLISISSIYGQNFLNEYFGGNIDSLRTEAFRLIHMAEATFHSFETTKMDPKTINDLGYDQIYPAQDYYFTVRDSQEIFSKRFPAPSNHTIVLIPGVASSAFLFNRTAEMFRKATQAEVFAIDLRGHGKSYQNRGDVDYIHQYADDLADVIQIIREQKSGEKVIIEGRSMGAGAALNYAMLQEKFTIDVYLFFALLMDHNSPAIPQVTPYESLEMEPMVKIRFARIIGIKMLNETDNHDYYDLPVLFFNFPGNMPAIRYSFRANMSMAPQDFKIGLEGVHAFLLVFIGSKDEAFDAEILHETVFEQSVGQIHIFDGVTYNGIRHHPQAYENIRKWFSTL